MIRLGPWGRCSMRTVAHSNACRFRSSRLAKLRPGKKFVSTVQKLRSSPALRLACPFSWQTNRKPCAVAKRSEGKRPDLKHRYHSYGGLCLKKKKKKKTNTVTEHLMQYMLYALHR